MRRSRGPDFDNASFLNVSRAWFRPRRTGNLFRQRRRYFIVFRGRIAPINRISSVRIIRLRPTRRVDVQTIHHQIYVSIPLYSYVRRISYWFQTDLRSFNRVLVNRCPSHVDDSICFSINRVDFFSRVILILFFARTRASQQESPAITNSPNNRISRTFRRWRAITTITHDWQWVVIESPEKTHSAWVIRSLDNDERFSGELSGTRQFDDDHCRRGGIDDVFRFPLKHIARFPRQNRFHNVFDFQVRLFSYVNKKKPSDFLKRFIGFF